jgi:hypothetical protein
MKVCCICKENKPLTDYHKDKSRVKDNGISNRCKKCKSNSDKKYRKKNKQKIKEIDKKYRSDPIIRENNRIRAYKWYWNNRDYAISYRRSHYINNWLQYKVNRKKWFEKHPNFWKTYIKMYVKTRKENDPNFALRCTLRSRFHSAITGNKKGKTNLEELCGCTIQFLRNWISSLFTKKFNWKNHGNIWHLDHVIPIAYYDLTNPSEMKKCFHWSNLQPLERIENLKKGSKIIYHIITSHYKKAIHYELNLIGTNLKLKNDKGSEYN